MKKYFVLFAIFITFFAMLLVTISVSAVLEIVDGDMQIGKPGEQFQEKLVVKLTNTEGTPIPDANIKFEEPYGFGMLSAESVTTDINGNASVYFTPDAETENIYGIVATHDKEFVIFVLLAIHTEIHSPDEKEIDLTNINVNRADSNSGHLQEVYINELSKPLRVNIVDRNSNPPIPIAGARVNFSTTSEHILLYPSTAVSDTSGNLAIRFRANKVGIYTITAQLNGTNSDSGYYRTKFRVYVIISDPGPSTPDPSTPDPSTPDPGPSTSNPRVSNTPLDGGYVVWLEEHDHGCQSGVIHSDYVYIDRENKKITFTGEDGEVDPGDTVRAYIKVETGYTYEQASERAPEILKECP